MRYMTLLFLVCLLACRKDEDPAQNNNTGIPCGTVAGIKARDVTGAQIGMGDTTDWQPFDTWCPAVEALFADTVPVTYSAEEVDSLFIIGYPNPAQEHFTLSVAGDDNERVDLRIVGTDHQLIWSQDIPMMTNTVLDLGGLGPSSGQIYRIYYRVLHSDGTAHRGHGDVQMEP